MPAAVEPAGRRTGYSHPRCFASADKNCSDTISREHFISKTLLRQLEFDGTAKIAGLRWQKPQSFNIVPLKGLAANVLCDRHNAALSPLDKAAGEFSQAIGDFDRALHRNADTAPAFERRRLDGEDLERWMLKCLIGMTVSGNIGGVLKPECIELLYDRSVWPEGWGLYWLNHGSPQKHHSQSIAIETATNPETGVIMLVRYLIRGMPLGLCLGKPDQPDVFGVLRPAGLHFRSRLRQRHLVLDWQRNPSATPISLDRVGTYDGPPPDWKDWEREG